jgi:hypothetical protein
MLHDVLNISNVISNPACWICLIYLAVFLIPFDLWAPLVMAWLTTPTTSSSDGSLLGRGQHVYIDSEPFRAIHIRIYQQP